MSGSRSPLVGFESVSSDSLPGEDDERMSIS